MALFPGRGLLVGVGNYRHAPRLDVPITAADAQALAAVLRDPDYCGYPQDRVRVLHDATASRDGILAALDDLAAQAGEDDTVFLFFCGHGDYGDDGDYYLTTHDTRFLNGKVASGSALREVELIERLRGVRAKRLLFLVNACHSGELSPTLGPDDATLTGTQLPSATAAALLATGEGRIVMTACRDRQVSYIGNGALTLFTQALVDGLRGEGTRSSSGFVSAFDLYLHLYDSVKETVEQKYGKTQEPELTVLKGVGPFAVSLFRGATALGDFDSTARPPEGTAVCEVSPERARSRLRQFNLHIGDRYSAKLRGDGAIAQGDGAIAFGKGAVHVGGTSTGNINTGSQTNTGGGARLAGDQPSDPK
jgi:hypothetical protein